MANKVNIKKISNNRIAKMSDFFSNKKIISDTNALYKKRVDTLKEELELCETCEERTVILQLIENEREEQKYANATPKEVCKNALKTLVNDYLYLAYKDATKDGDMNVFKHAVARQLEAYGVGGTDNEKAIDNFLATTAFAVSGCRADAVKMTVKERSKSDFATTFVVSVVNYLTEKNVVTIDENTHEIKRA